MTDPNPIEKLWEGSQAQQFMATNVDHKAEDLTKSAAKGLADSTKGTAIEIKEEKATGAIPWVAGGAVAVIGLLLLEPIQWVTKNVFKGARKVVTGFGVFEKIPILGEAFKMLGDAVEAVGEGVSYIVPLIAGFIGYKAFATQEHKPNKSGGGMPGNENGHAADMAAAATIPASVTATSAAIDANAMALARKDLLAKPPEGAKRMAKAQRIALEEELGGEEEFNRIHKYLYGDEPVNGKVDSRLTYERANILLEKVREVKSDIWDEAAKSGENKAFIKAEIAAETRANAGSRLGRSARWIGNKATAGKIAAPPNKAAARIAATKAVRARLEQRLFDSDDIAGRVIEKLGGPEAVPTAGATIAAQNVAAQISIDEILENNPTIKQHWQDYLDWASGKTPGQNGYGPSPDQRALAEAIKADPKLQAEILEQYQLEFKSHAGEPPLQTLSETAAKVAAKNAPASTPTPPAASGTGATPKTTTPGTTTETTPPTTGTDPLNPAAAEVAAETSAASEAGFFSNSVGPGYRGALGITAAATALPTLLNPDSTKGEKWFAAGTAAAGTAAAFVEPVAKVLGPVGGGLIAYTKGEEAIEDFKHGRNWEGGFNTAEAVGGTALVVGGVATGTAALGLGGAGVATVANPVGAIVVTGAMVGYAGYLFASTASAYSYIDKQFQKSDKFANLLSIQGRYIDEFIAKGGTTYDVEVDQGDGTKVIRKKIDYSNAANENIIREVIENNKKKYIDIMDANDSWRPHYLQWTNAQATRDNTYKQAELELRVLNSAQEEIGGYGKSFRVAASQITTNVPQPLVQTDTQNLGQFTSPLTPAQSDQPAIQAGKETPAAPAKG